MKQYYAFEWTNGVGNYDSNYHNLPIGLLHFLTALSYVIEFVSVKPDTIALEESAAKKLLARYISVIQSTELNA